MEFSYASSISNVELYHNPPVNSITDDSGEETSTLIWTTTANENIKDKNLQCTIVGHPAGTKTDSKLIAVYGKCVFVVYFHQIFNSIRLLVETRMQKFYMKRKRKRKRRYIAPLDDDEATVHCSMANSPRKADSRQES